MLSSSIQNGLSKLFDGKASFITVVQHGPNKLFLVILSTAIIFMDEGFDEMMGKVSFGCLDRIIVSIKDATLFQLHFNGKLPSYMPAKMNLHCQERAIVVKFLRHGWKSDYMSRYLDVIDLPVYKGAFKDTITVEMLKSPKTKLLELQENQGYEKKYEHMSYNIYLPKNYKVDIVSGLYKNETLKSHFSLQITDQQPLEVLRYIGDREDLEYYCEAFVKDLVGENDHWIMSSSQYVKRKNIYNDSAEWSGWQVHARELVVRKVTKDEIQHHKKFKDTIEFGRDVVVIILRRKYIPPFIDSFVDIVLRMYGPENYGDMKGTKVQTELDDDDPQIPEDEEDEDEEEGHKKENAMEAYKKAVESIYNDQYVQNHAREAADTIVPQILLPFDPSYKPMLKFMTDNLIYDEECMLYLQYKMQIESTWKSIANDVLKLIHQNKPGIWKFIEDAIEGQLPKVNSNKEHKGQAKIKRHLQYKFSRYLALCLDGGIDSTINFDSLINRHKGSSEFYKVLDYCLFAISEATGTQNDFAPDENFKKLSKIVNQRYLYNERVMSSLFSTQLFVDELLKKEANQQLYVDLVQFLLLNGKSCRQSICRHLIKFQCDTTKEALTELQINLLKTLIQPLLQLYQGPNSRLATLACVAMLNMCANNKEFKYQIMKDEGLPLLVAGLSSRNQNYLNYTLRLIYSLLQIVQNIEQFNKLQIIPKLTIIINKNKIVGAHYSAECQITVCKIISKCMNKTMNHYTKQMVEVIKLHSDEYYADIEIIDRLKAEAINTIFTILSFNIDNKNIFTDINKDLMPYILEILRQPISIDLKRSSVRIMCLFRKIVPDLAADWIEKDKIAEANFYKKIEETRKTKLTNEELERLDKEKYPSLLITLEEYERGQDANAVPGADYLLKELYPTKKKK